MNKSQNPGGGKKWRATFCSCGTVCARESDAGLEWLFERGHWESRWKRSYFLMPCGGHKAFLQRMHRKWKGRQGAENCPRKFDMGWKFFLCLGPAGGAKCHCLPWELRFAHAQLLAKASLMDEFFPLPLRKHNLGVISKRENEEP